MNEIPKQEELFPEEPKEPWEKKEEKNIGVLEKMIKKIGLRKEMVPKEDTFKKIADESRKNDPHYNPNNQNLRELLKDKDK